MMNRKSLFIGLIVAIAISGCSSDLHIDEPVTEHQRQENGTGDVPDNFCEQYSYENLSASAAASYERVCYKRVLKF